MSLHSAHSRALRFRLISLVATIMSVGALIVVRPADPALAASQSTLNQYRVWMEQARAMYPYTQSVDKMWRVMMCESSGRAYVASPSGTYKGLFQYHINTWRGSWNPYRYNSVWDARSQIFATAKAWSLGHQSWWSCYYITAGR